MMPEYTDNAATQKLIALSIIGYLEAIRKYNYDEPDINYIFKPLMSCAKMTELGFDDSIISAMSQIDEIPILCGMSDRHTINVAIEKIIDPMLKFLNSVRVPNDGAAPSIKKLLF